MKKIRSVMKLFVSDEGMVTITCPHCGASKQASVAKFCGKKQSIRVTCGCGSSFTILLELRKSYRKRTDLQGTYRIVSGGGGGGPVTIRDISKDGVGFSVSGRYAVRKGQRVLLDFTLDDRKLTRLQKEVIVRYARRDRVGGQFCNRQAFEKDLGFYVQP